MPYITTILLYSYGVPKYGLIPLNHSVSTTYAFNNSVSTTYPFNNSVFTTYPYIKSVATTLPFSAIRQVSTDKKKKDQKQHLKILLLVLKPFISSLLTAIPILPLTSTRQSQRAMSVQYRCTSHDLFVKSGFKNDATVLYRTCKIKHTASLCICHRKRLDLFLRYKPD